MFINLCLSRSSTCTDICRTNCMFSVAGPKAHYVVDCAIASGSKICHFSLRDGNRFHHGESESFSVTSDSSTPRILQSMEFSRILDWVAFPFSRGSSQPRNRTRVSYIAGGFFTNWAIREAHERDKIIQMKSFFSPVNLQAEEISYKDGYSHGERRMTQRVRTKISKGATKISSESFSGK